MDNGALKHELAEWMRAVMAATGWSAAAWAKRAGTSASNLTRMVASPDLAAVPRADTLAKLARAVPESADIASPSLVRHAEAGADDGFVAFPGEAPAQAHMPRNLPVYGSARGGEDGAFLMNGSVIEFTERPPSLDTVKNGYSVYVQGDSMSPRYEAGWLLYVHPSKPVRRGDNVVIQLRASEEEPPLAFVKIYEGKSTTRLMARQFNPPKLLEWDLAEVVSVHLIVGCTHF